MLLFSRALVCFLFLLPATWLADSRQAAAAEIDFSCVTSLGYTGLDRESDINTMFRGDDPFNPIRVTVFMESWLNPRFGIFVEFLWDHGRNITGGDTKPRINGAYALANPFDTDNLMFKIGLVPTTFGTWAPRTYSDRNPLIGLPMLYHYITPAKNSRLAATTDELRTWKHDRGMPMVYDACWDNGVIAFGFLDKFDYRIGITKASTSSPRAYQNDGFQVIGRLGVKPVIGMQLGASFAHGSYLGPDAEGLPAGSDPEDIYVRIAGFDFHYSRAHTILYAELASIWWENPHLDKALNSVTWYVEAKQKMLFPGFYLAARLDRFTYDHFFDSGDVEFSWGDNVTRLEAGAGYHFTRDILLKTVWQHNIIVDRENVDLLSTQLVVTF